MDHSVLIVVLAGLLAIPVLASLVLRRRIDPFLPPILFSVCIFAGYVLPAQSFIEGTDAFSLAWPASYGAFEESLRFAVVVTIIGVMGFYMGYVAMATFPPIRGKATRVSMYHEVVWDRFRLLLLGTVYTIVGLGLFIMGVVLIGGVEALLSGLGDRVRLFAGLNYFFSAADLLLVVSIVWWGFLLKMGRIRDQFFWVYTVIAFGVISLQGSKSTLVVFILCLVVMYHFLYRNISALITIAGSVVLAVLMTFYALFTREYMVMGDFVTFDLGQVDLDSVLDVMARGVGGDFLQLQALTTVVENVPHNLPYQFGETYLSLATSFLPATLYPDKYLTAPGVFTLAVWPDQWLTQGTTMPPGLMGEMYMNFGALGVFLGMFLFGSLYGYCYARVHWHSWDPLRVALYALLVAMMPHYIRGEAVAPTILLAILGIPTFVAMRFVLKPIKGENSNSRVPISNSHVLT